MTMKPKGYMAVRKKGRWRHMSLQLRNKFYIAAILDFSKIAWNRPNWPNSNQNQKCKSYNNYFFSLKGKKNATQKHGCQNIVAMETTNHVNNKMS